MRQPVRQRGRPFRRRPTAAAGGVVGRARVAVATGARWLCALRRTGSGVCSVVLVLFAGVLLGVALTSLGGAVTSSGASSESAVTRLVGSLLGLYVLLVLAALFFGASAILGAIFALFGKTFHYPLIGRKRR